MTSFRIAVIAMVAALGAKGADPIEIDAHGGVIPDAGSQTEVHITKAEGTGDAITLEADKVTAAALVQKQSAAAVVQMLREQQLLLGGVTIESEMGDLTIGEADALNEGLLGGIGSHKFAFTVNDVGGSIYVNAVFTNAMTKTAVKGGDGKVVANGDFHASVDQVNGTMSYAVATASAEGELPTMSVGGYGLIYDFDSAGFDPIFGDDVSSVSDSAKEAVITATKGTMVPWRGFNVGGGTQVLMENVDAYQPAAVETLDFHEADVPGSLTVGSNSVGVLVMDGGSLSARLEIGRSYSSYNGKGALYLNGGAAVTNICSSTNDERLVGSGGFGYLEVCGRARYVAAGQTVFASSGHANLFITNGTFVSTADKVRPSGIVLAETLGRVGLYVGAKGSFDVSGSTGGIEIPGTAADSVLVTVEDGGVINLGTTRLESNGNVIFNFNDGGEFIAGNIEKSGSSAFFQFNGGIFRPTEPYKVLLEGKITSFEKGTTFNITSGSSDISAEYPLLAPTGNGLVSIDVPETLSERVFVGAPILVVSGDGYGASAICQLDEEGHIVGFKVVGHGDGYSWGKATIYYGGNDSYDIGSDCLHFADNVSGGMTKTGKGTLIVKGQCTYTGDTLIRQGKVTLNGSGSISPLSGLKIYGDGILDVGGGTQSFSNYAGDGTGCVTNGIVSLDGLVFDMDRVKSGDIDTLKFSSNIVFAVSAGVKLLNASEQELVRNKDYVLCNLTGTIPERFPSFDPETRGKLSDPWGIMIQKDESGASAKAVLHYFGGSYFIYY